MKTLQSFFLITLVMMISVSASAQKESKKYLDAMHHNLDLLDTAIGKETLLNVANSCERIAKAEKDKWLPYYYAAYSLARASYLLDDKDKIDPMLDKAEEFINMADSLEPDNSEIYVVKSFVTSARIMVNPMSRGAQYGPASSVLLEKAISLDETNPRPYYLKGTSAFYTPPAFGGGKDKAKPLLETALEKFKTFKPKNDLMPNWGAVHCQMMLDQCK